MKQFALLLAATILPFIGFCQRKIDMGVKLLHPVDKQVIQSPQYGFPMIYTLYNLGPDTIKSYDAFQMGTNIGNSYAYKTPLLLFGKELNPGQSDTFTFKVSFTGNVTVDSIPYCIYLDKFITTSNTDSLQEETAEMKKNNNSCAYVNHIKAAGIINNDEDVHVVAYPNPSDGLLNLSLPHTVNNNAFLTVYDLHGKAVKTITIRASKTALQLTDLPNGMYFLHLQGIELNECIKWLKQSIHN